MSEEKAQKVIGWYLSIKDRDFWQRKTSMAREKFIPPLILRSGAAYRDDALNGSAVLPHIDM
jgi:hypothetical protein